MSRLQIHAKQWVNANMFDGEDRSGSHSDVALFTAPELYELVADLVEYLEECNDD